MARVKPVIPLALEVDERYEEVNQNGQSRPAVLQSHTPETIEAMRHGYVCVRCWERQSEPFPRECVVCKYKMADRQAEEFHRMYQGKQQIGLTRDKVDEEMERLDRMQHAHDMGLWTPGDPI